jgi:hypothetical protein
VRSCACGPPPQAVFSLDAVSAGNGPLSPFGGPFPLWVGSGRRVTGGLVGAFPVGAWGGVVKGD